MKAVEKIPADDPLIESFCLNPGPRGEWNNGWQELADGTFRPRTSIMVHEREKSICITVGTDRHFTPRTKRWQPGTPYETRPTNGSYKNHRYTISWRSGDLRAYELVNSRRGRSVHQVTSYAYPVSHGITHPDLVAAVMRGIERSRARGEKVPAQIIDRTLNTTIHTGAYPMISDERAGWLLRSSLGMGTALRAETAQEFTLKVFGRRAYRKDLVKAAAGANQLWQVALARSMRGLVPVDWIVNWLRSMDQVVEQGAADAIFDRYFPEVNVGGEFNLAADFKQLLMRVDENSRRRLLRDDLSLGHAQDSLRTLRYIGRGQADDQEVPWREIPYGDVGTLSVRSWRDLHDQVVAINHRELGVRTAVRERRYQAVVRGDFAGVDGEIDYWARQREVSEAPIPQTDIAIALDGLEVVPAYPVAPYAEEVYEIRSAKNVKELAEWGQAMRNCIAGYGDVAIRGTTHLFGVYLDEKLVANMEVASSGEIRQLYGRFNARLERTPDRAIRDAVKTVLRESEVLPLARATRGMSLHGIAAARVADDVDAMHYAYAALPVVPANPPYPMIDMNGALI